jgi:hypothetical protein
VSQLTTKRSQADRDEEALFEKSLREHGQLADAGVEKLAPGVTHRVETNEKGERKVVRKRYSAI